MMWRSHQTVRDVMTRDVVTVQTAAPFKHIVELLAGRGVGALPVVDDHGFVVGVVSEADLLEKEAAPPGHADASRLELLWRRLAPGKAEATTATELMTAPPVTVPADARLSAAARRMLDKGVKRLPVIGDRGELLGIVSRSDLLKVFLRADDEIRIEVHEGIIGREMGMDPFRFDVSVSDGVVTLVGKAERRSQIALLTGRAREVEGVVEVVDQLTYELDDVTQPMVFPHTL